MTGISLYSSRAASARPPYELTKPSQVSTAPDTSHGPSAPRSAPHGPASPSPGFSGSSAPLLFPLFPIGPSAPLLSPHGSSAPNCLICDHALSPTGPAAPASTLFYAVYYGPPRARPPDWPKVPDHENEDVSSIEGDDYLFFVQPDDGVTDSHAASAYTEIAIEYAVNGARRVPHGPKPDTGRPKKKYKPVAKKVRPLQEQLPQEYRIQRNRPADCMDSLPELPAFPPTWEPTTAHLTRERMDGFDLSRDGFLWPEEIKLFQFLIEYHQAVFAWTEAERRRFKESYFPPIRYPVVPHEPWADRNIPVPHAVRARLIELLKEKIAAGVYEPLNSAYRSGWFCIVKKDGTSLRIVHDLQRLNSVTIRDAGTLPSPDDFSERCAGRACIGALDQFSSYDLQLVHPDSRDITTFQSDVGPLRIVSLPQGWTNSVAIQHGNLVFILAPEMPEHVDAFVDDVHPLGPRSHYLQADGSYETVPGNTGIRRFIWEYAHVLNRVLQRLDHSGASISGKKAVICAPSVTVVGYEVSFAGRRPMQDRIQRVIDWPACESVSDVRAFLGTAGLVRMWIRNFSLIARPLTNLVKKDIPFDFNDACHDAMIKLKEGISMVPCLKPIDYACGRSVILAVDSSIYGVGFVLIKLGEKGERCPSRFGSITWNDVESRYSQPKIELYGLWRALRNTRLYIFGLPVLLVEVDAKYIKGMLNNPDTQPNATINRWIAGVLLFNIKLVHVPADRHTAADGLSRRKSSPNDPQEEDDAEEWLDSALGLWLSIALPRPPQSLPPVGTLGYRMKYRAATARDRRYLMPPPDGPFAVAPLAVLVSQSWPSPTPALPTNRLEDGTVIAPPRSPALLRKDEHIRDVDHYLQTLELPDIDKKHIPWFVRQCAHFFRHDNRLWRRSDDRKHKVVIISQETRVSILESAHDGTGHKGVFPTEALIRDRFWWPGLAEDIRWYCATCKECQHRQTFKLHIPPTVACIATLFQRTHVDTMHLPASKGKKYLLHMRCALISFPEAAALARETGKAIGEAIFRLILCRWGYCGEIISDNGPPMILGIEYLAEKYGIRHIRISGYNSQANGAIERKHYDVREALVKTCDGDISRWTDALDFVLWAERVTIRKTTGMSPYFMAHGVEPVMPLDFAHATYLVPPQQPRLTTEDLIVLRARQLQRREDDLEMVREAVRSARYAAIADFMRRHGHSVRDFNFQPGELVLVRNTRIEKDLGLKKIDDRYYGPMVVVQRSARGSYVLAELDGSVSIRRCAAFRVIPFFPRSRQAYDINDILETSKAQLELIDKIENKLQEDNGDNANSDTEQL